MMTTKGWSPVGPLSLAVGVVMALVMAFSAPASAAGEVDPGGGVGEGPGEEIPDPPFVPPANGFVWTMQPRFGPLHNGIVDYHWNEARPAPLRWGATEDDRERYDPAHVNPAAFNVDFYGCPSAEEDEASRSNPPAATNTYDWIVAGQALGPKRSCLLTHSFASQGSYQVSVTITGPDAAGPFHQQVVIKDHLIVSIGDSYGSGEGNPDVARTADQPARWADRRCHRSAKAGPAQAALALERSDPHSSVTFLSFACSGATISRVYNAYSDACPGDQPTSDTYKADAFDPYKPGDPNRPGGSGVISGYQGAEPPNCSDFGDHLRPQIQQLTETVGDRRIDALITSAGGNDVGFGPLAATCVASGIPFGTDSCQQALVSGDDGNKYQLETRFEQDRRAMAGRYAAMNQAIRDARLPSGEPLRIAGTYITEYPDSTTDRDPETGAVRTCDTMLEDASGIVGGAINGKEVEWARQTVLPALNEAVRAAAVRHGWQYVDGMAAAFQGHGYCVGNVDTNFEDGRWIRTANESKVLQGPDDRSKNKGTLHPTTRGHQVYKDRLLAYIQPALAALSVDDTTDPAAPTVALDALVGPGNQSTVRVLGTGETATTASILMDDTNPATAAVTTSTPVGATGYAASIDLSGLSDGTLTASVRLTDGAGNTSPTASASATKDTVAPATTVTASPNANAEGWHRGSTTINLSAADTRTGISSITYSMSGAQSIPPTTLASASASLTISAEGETTVSFSARDDAGNVETVGSYLVKIDLGAPTSAINGAATRTTVKAGTGSLTGSAHDNLSSVAATTATFTNTKTGVTTRIITTCTLGCGTNATAWSVSTAALPAGTYTVAAVSSDAASNIGPASPTLSLNVRK